MQLEEFTNLGCREHFKATLAHQVLHDLYRTNKYFRLEKAYISDYDIIYVIGSKEDGTHIFIPLLHSQQLDLIRLENLQKILEEKHENSILHLALSDGASNILYYTITPRFVDDSQKWSKKLSNDLDYEADSNLSN